MTDSYSRSTVVKIISQVQEKLGHLNDSVEHSSLFNEIQSTLDDLKVKLMEARKELSVDGSSLNGFTEELSAAIDEAASAANRIIDLTSAIQELTADIEPSETKSKIEEKLSEIIVACSFQDITGQRISKVGEFLKGIEESADKLSGMLDTAAQAPEANDKILDEKDLMNGPQMGDKALSQEDIDKMLDDF